MEKVLEKMHEIGIIPVVVISDIETVRPLAEALCEGGLPCAEVTFRTKEAKEAIRIMTTEFPEMLVGAGTVLTTAQVDEAMDAKAQFIVSPGCNPNIITYCQEKNISMTPGVCTPSDIERALELGIDHVKFFPAEASGGLNMVKNLAAPYTNVHFMPTGGITAENVEQYLHFPKVFACGGTWMVKKNLLEEGNYKEIKRLCKEAAEIVKCVRA